MRIDIDMKNYKKYFKISATPEAVYKAYTRPELIEVWTSADVVFEEKENTEFSLFDGDVTGRNIKFVEGSLIQQEWYFENEAGMESIVTLKFHADKDVTSLEVQQTNIPDDAYDNILMGWTEVIIPGICEVVEEE